MSPSGLEYLRHILDEIDYLSRAAQGTSAEEFLEDETLKRAFVRSLEIIGEATKKLPMNTRERFPGIECAPWQVCEIA